MSEVTLESESTHVVVAPDGLYWVGLAFDEADAWRIALGWPNREEILDHIEDGWYCTKANITWIKPT